MIELKQIKQIKKLTERDGKNILKVSNFAGQKFANNPNTKITKKLKSGFRYNMYNELGTDKMFEMIFLTETNGYYVCPR